MAELKRAHTTKRTIETNTSIPIPPNKKTRIHPPTTNPEENATITSLRQDQNLPWRDIAATLNQQRLAADEPASLTETAVYTRFVFATTRAAQPKGEMGFDAKDYVHLRRLDAYSEGAATVSKAGKKRVKNYEDARELRANVRQPVGAEAHGDLDTAAGTEQLVEAVARVARNFWAMVADEMERATTKFYTPDELARRYHAM